MLVLKIAAGIVLAFILLTAGCAALVGSAMNDATSKDKIWQVEISAPAGACWSGSVGDASKDGCGSQTLTFTDMAVTAAVIQKQTPGHWTLSASLVRDGSALDATQTSAEYGLVTVSGANFTSP